MDGFFDVANWDEPSVFWSDDPGAERPNNRKRFMEEYALKLKEKTLEEKESTCIGIEQGLTGTGHVPTAAALAAALAAKRGQITTQKGVLANAESLVVAEQNGLDTLESELDGLLTETCKAAQSAVGGDRDKMAEMNIPLRRLGAVSGQVPDAPTNVRGSYGDMIGEVDFQWDGMGRGVIYFGELAEDPNGPFTQSYVGSRSRCTCKNLVAGKMYYFRVTAERNGLRSNASELANHRAR
jgi:hypothetical protein